MNSLRNNNYIPESTDAYHPLKYPNVKYEDLIAKIDKNPSFHYNNLTFDSRKKKQNVISNSSVVNLPALRKSLVRNYEQAKQQL